MHELNNCLPRRSSRKDCRGRRAWRAEALAEAGRTQNPVATALCAVCPAALNNPNAPQGCGYTRISVIPFLGSCFETRSSPESLSATHRAFAFYLGNPISSIPGLKAWPLLRIRCSLINKQRALAV